MRGLNNKYNYSNWIMDKEDTNYNCLHEGPGVKGTVASLPQLRRILSAKMMTLRNDHYHVRDSGWTRELEEGISLAKNKLASLMGMDTPHPEADESSASPTSPSPSTPSSASSSSSSSSSVSAPAPEPTLMAAKSSDTGAGTKMAMETSIEMRTRFFEELREKGMSRRQVSGDGFCLFHSIVIGKGGRV